MYLIVRSASKYKRTKESEQWAHSQREQLKRRSLEFEKYTGVLYEYFV